jgi:diguanylate cyclase (GGDEF)-like protein/PAS domain S-box-containing protein
MNDIEHLVDTLIETLHLDQREIKLRKAFLQLDEKDEKRLAEAHKLLGNESLRFADAFYEHLSQFAPLRGLLEAEGRLSRLKHVQSHYFRTLTAGNYGDEYVRNRLRVGLVHQRIGLEPAWYLGAYRKYVSEMQRMLWLVMKDDPQEYLSTCDALMKIVNFDISLALDTYFHADTQEVREHKDYAESIVSTMPSGLMVISANLIVLSMNPAMRTMLELDQERTAEGSPLATLIKSSLLLEACTDVLATGVAQKSILVTLSTTDTRVRLDFSLSRTCFRGKPLLLMMSQDVTGRFQAEAQLAQSEERYRLTFDNAAVGLAQSDSKGRITRVNNKLCQILGYEQEELLGIRFPRLIHADDRADAQAMISRVLAGELQNYSRERRYLHKDGRVIWTNATVSCQRFEGQQAGLIVVLDDISARKHMQAELIRLASHDGLTGLPNRTLLQDRLNKALALARRNQRQVAVMYLDLDHFKDINDSHGHAAGDALLAEVARRLTTLVRDTDTVARLGGDEFVIVLESLGECDAAAYRARAIVQAISSPFRYKGRELYTSASVGVAMYPSDGVVPDDLLKHADSAMYRAKESGRNAIQFYTADIDARLLRRLEISDGLRHALERDELRLHFQPKLRTDSGQLVGAEALLRWVRSDGTHVAPEEMIPVAEETGMILAIGQWVLEQACRQAVAWRAQGFSDLRVSVNLSARQFRNQDIIQVVRQTLRKTKCPAGALELEITESVLMEQPDEMASVLGRLQSMGVRLSIDDFGTGYSSLSYLRNFPIHELKVDRSFIENMADNPNHSAIVDAVIKLAHSLGLTVLAEGVETLEQLHCLRAQGCDHVQGFLFSRPLPVPELQLWMKQGLRGQSGTVHWIPS